MSFFLSKSFSINLQTGPNLNPRSNTALHFNPRLNDNCVVRNHYQHHSWGGEERGGYQPFQRGMPFEVVILCQHHHYKVCLYGREVSLIYYSNSNEICLTLLKLPAIVSRCCINRYQFSPTTSVKCFQFLYLFVFMI